MDKTKEFILMCEKAVEIQEKWIPKVHDLFNKRGVKYSNGGEVFPRLHYVTGCGRMWMDAARLIKYKFHSTPKFKKAFFGDLTFIPRQDQLQEMMNLSTFTLFDRFKSFICCLNLDFFDKNTLKQLKEKGHSSIEYIDFVDYLNKFTMEQLWLAFVMKEKYNKIWNGKEWEKNG